MFYNDGRHPLIYRFEPPMRPDDLEIAVDELAGTPVDALMFCLGDGRTVLHDTEVGELWGHNVESWPHAIFHRAHRNAQGLIDAGHDPLRVVCDRAHAKGMRFYPTLLVQNGRGGGDDDVRCSEFRFASAHLELGADGALPPEHPGARCLDFARAEVRDERFALIEETLDRYPVDGFELQLAYRHWYFRPDAVDAGRGLMTGWIERVHAAVKAGGAGRELVVRVPASIDGCRDSGLDVAEWLRLGLVDVVVAEAFGAPELLDSTMDLRPLVAAARGTRGRVHATLLRLVDSDRVAAAPIEMVRAAAANYWDQGVDGLYLAYWHAAWPYGADFYEMLRELPHPDVMAAKDKIYFVPTATGRFPDPQTEPGVARQLPAPLTTGQPARVTFAVSDDLPRQDEAGRLHRVLLRVRVTGVSERDRLTVRLNGAELPAAAGRIINLTANTSWTRHRVAGYWYLFPLTADCWPRRGRNTLEVTLDEADPELTTPRALHDVELKVDYLIGKSFTRDRDLDLGPFA